MLLLHAGAVCGLIVAAGYDRATCAPLAFMGLIAVNVIWLTAALLTSGPDGRVLRGVWYVVILDLAAGLVVFLVVWVREGLIPLAGASGGSELILITACGGLALCLAQAWLGARVHCKRGRIMLPDVTREGRAGIA
jgi:hypothetical protein